MAFVKECQQLMEEKYWQEDEVKEEKGFLFLTK